MVNRTAAVSKTVVNQISPFNRTTAYHQTQAVNKTATNLRAVISANGGQPFAGQPGQGGNRNREPNHAPVPPPQQVRIHNGNATVIRAGGNAHVTTIRTTNFTINRTDYGPPRGNLRFVPAESPSSASATIVD